MEATGIYHHVVYKFLQRKRSMVSWPFKILVVNPADAAGLPGRQKHDRLDAEMLAKYLAKGLLKNGKVIIEVLEDLKALFRMAFRLEKDRTALKNRIKKTLDRAGIRPRFFNLNHQWTREFLQRFIDQSETLGSFMTRILDEERPEGHFHAALKKNLRHFLPYFDFSLTPVQRALVRQDLAELNYKTGRKALLSVEIDQVILNHPALGKHANDLASIPGISPFSAAWILAEIGNIHHFSTVRKFRAYCGCCPRIVSSGGKVYSAHLTRHSNAYLRTLFYNAAVVVCNFVKQKSALKEHADRISARKSSRNKKLVYSIVAAKIVHVVFALLKNNTSFIPYPNTTLKPHEKSSPTSKFTVCDRKTLRRARNNLRRVQDIHEIDILGTHAEQLAQELDKVLIQGKNFSD